MPGGREYNLAWQDWLNLRNQATAAWLIARSALERAESRGSHHRSDLPTPAPDLYNVYVRAEDKAGPRVWTEPVRLSDSAPRGAAAEPAAVEVGRLTARRAPRPHEALRLMPERRVLKRQLLQAEGWRDTKLGMWAWLIQRAAAVALVVVIALHLTNPFVRPVQALAARARAAPRTPRRARDPARLRAARALASRAPRGGARARRHDLRPGLGLAMVLKVFRWAPGAPRAPRRSTRSLQEGMTVLDALVDVQRRLDPTLAFRYACRVGMCGSCAMVIDGRERWACRTLLTAWGAGR